MGVTEEEIQGKWCYVRNSGVFEITEFELAGSNCITSIDDTVKFVYGHAGTFMEIRRGNIALTRGINLKYKLCLYR